MSLYTAGAVLFITGAVVMSMGVAVITIQFKLDRYYEFEKTSTIRMAALESRMNLVERCIVSLDEVEGCTHG